MNTGGTVHLVQGFVAYSVEIYSFSPSWVLRGLGTATSPCEDLVSHPGLYLHPVTAAKCRSLYSGYWYILGRRIKRVHISKTHRSGTHIRLQ